MPLPPPRALSPLLPSDLLTYILTHAQHAAHTTLIVCSTRAAFLASLHRSIPPQPSGPEAAPHHLLVPTLHQLSVSRNVQICFAPTCSHLRAQLAVLGSGLDPESTAGRAPAQQHLDEGKAPALVVLYKLVEAHRDTSEWSAQGLGATLANLVEAGLRAQARIMLCEEKSMEGGEDAEDNPGALRGDSDAVESGEMEVDHAEGTEDGATSRRKVEWWKERLPMLSGSVKRAGLGAQEAWTGRTIEVGRVLGRWCVFAKEEQGA